MCYNLYLLLYLVVNNKYLQMFKAGQSGNPNGRPVGAKSEKTKQWEVLHESITNQHAASFNAVLDELLNSDEIDEKIVGSELYIKMLEYFKPKQARTQVVGDKNEPIQIIISDKI